MLQDQQDSDRTGTIIKAPLFLLMLYCIISDSFTAVSTTDSLDAVLGKRKSNFSH